MFAENETYTTLMKCNMIGARCGKGRPSMRRATFVSLKGERFGMGR